MGIQLKKVHNILLYDAGQFYIKKDGGRIKICETFSDSSLKEDLLIDTTFDPCYLSWDSPFKGVDRVGGGHRATAQWGKIWVIFAEIFFIILRFVAQTHSAMTKMIL